MKRKETKGMKHMKKFASILLVLVMVLGMTTTAFAAGNYTITIENSASGHTYEADQIFGGELALKDKKKVLSNVVWGSGVTKDGQTALGDAAKKAEELEKLDDAASFAEAVGGYLASPAGSANEPVNGKYVINGLEPGYYLIKDQDKSLSDKNDAYTKYIVKVVDNVTAAPKSDVPEVEKKVKDINDSDGKPQTEWQDSADYDIGDVVPFQLKATLADNVSAYKTYKAVFHDTMSAGLTYNNDAKVYIDGAESNGFAIDSTPGGNGTSLTVSCDNVKALGAGDNSVITVEYTATLNEGAVLGSKGNPNKVYLEFSNNPNQNQGGEPETGKTPEDVVIVFTYKTVINKVDQDKNPLPGAEFALEKFVASAKGDVEYKGVLGSWAEKSVIKNNAGTIFTFNGLDDGEYRIKETATPAGYNTVADIYFTVTAEHEILSDNPALTGLSGDEGTGELIFTADEQEGSLTTDIENKKGTTLPETGGIGTTVFYILGSVLVLGAVVLLITKKRMNMEK